MKYKFYSCYVCDKLDDGDFLINECCERGSYIVHKIEIDRGKVLEITGPAIILLKYGGKFVAYGKFLRQEGVPKYKKNKMDVEIFLTRVEEWSWFNPNQIKEGPKVVRILDHTYDKVRRDMREISDVKWVLGEIKKINPNTDLYKELCKEYRRPI